MDRLSAWKQASKLVAPIVKTHGLEKYSLGASLFTTGIGVSTPVDQHITHIMDVADWLLNERD